MKLNVTRIVTEPKAWKFGKGLITIICDGHSKCDLALYYKEREYVSDVKKKMKAWLRDAGFFPKVTIITSLGAPEIAPGLYKTAHGIVKA